MIDWKSIRAEQAKLKSEVFEAVRVARASGRTLRIKEFVQRFENRGVGTSCLYRWVNEAAPEGLKYGPLSVGGAA